MFSGFASWFRSLLDLFGLFPRNAKLCFLGLDNAGKSTLLHMLKENRVSLISPTLYPSNEELIINSIRFRAFDLGGHETARRIWRDYYTSVNGILFLVDAADRTRFEEAREELQRLLADNALVGVPVAVLGNKIDIPIAASEDELRAALDLPHHRTAGRDARLSTAAGKQAQPAGAPLVEVFMCSVVKRMGYMEAFEWLSCVGVAA